MTKEELLEMFQKVRTQTLQKKQAVESLEVCALEKDEIRNKAIVVIQRCKDLEEKQASLIVYKSKCESYEILFEEQKIKLRDLENQLMTRVGKVSAEDNVNDYVVVNSPTMPFVPYRWGLQV